MQDESQTPAGESPDAGSNAASATQLKRDDIKVESSQKTTEPEVTRDDSEEAQNEPEESAGSESGDAPAQQPRKKPGVHQRIDELTKLRHDAERERDYWREQAMRPQQPQQAPAVEPADTGEPTLESCDFDAAEFTRKWYAWRRTEDQKAEAAQQRTVKLSEKEQAFRALHPDYDAVAKNPALPITQQVAEVILDADDPPAIAYYLGQNPQEAAAIAQMTPAQIGRAIGRIEATLSAPPASEQTRQPAPKTVSKAPPPVTTLSGAASVRKSYDDMTQAEYEQARREERRAKGLEP